MYSEQVQQAQHECFVGQKSSNKLGRNNAQEDGPIVLNHAQYPKCYCQLPVDGYPMKM